jgi:hypothetical protein
LSNRRCEPNPIEERGVSSARKIAANRTSARSSTGPKTAQGRARAARNALRHGLNVPIYSDPAMTQELDMLAREIAGAGPHAEIGVRARGVAKAYLGLRRVRLARHRHLLDALRADAQTDVASPIDIGAVKFALTASQTRKLLAMDRYEGCARLRLKSAIEAFDEARNSASD